MKKIILTFISLFFLIITPIASASIFWGSDSEIPYCEWNDCGLQQWIEQVKNSWVDWLVTEGKASEYIQWITVYILGFLSLIAVIIIIYAWFNLLTSAWDEEKSKKSKTIIIFTIIWLVIIYLAWPITKFVIWILTQSI